MGGVLVPDNGQETEVQGDVTGSVQSGAFHGPVQTVNVHIPEPPDTIRQQIKEIWMMFAHDRFERQDRQKAYDRWFILISIGVLISLAIGVFNSFSIWQFVSGG